MKNIFKFLFLFVFVPMLVTTSCKKDPVESTAEFDVLTKYLKDNNMDLSDITAPGWIKPGSAIVDSATYGIPGYYIIDLRSPADFATGHIKDAHNATLTGILEAAALADKKILVVCYTGQTAARGTAALRLSGYSDAACLKWGMSGWNADFDSKWVSHAKDLGHANWVKTGTPAANKEFDHPKLSTGKTTGADILKARVAKMLTLDWQVTNTEVLDAPGDYFINNKWSQSSWDTYGHITGAYRINEDLKVDGLKYLDSSKPMVTYCYTGQTSAITTAWLQVCGYENARSLLFGANGINWSELRDGDAHKKSWHGAGSASELNFEYVTD